VEVLDLVVDHQKHLEEAVDLAVEVLDVVVELIYMLEVVVIHPLQTLLKEIVVDQTTLEVVEVVEEPQLLDQVITLQITQQELVVMEHQIILQEVQ
jgi:hypothetical protein|tara:strand:+ start:204 stop:491 length:288 start_codon:yes stop_codon:yes gene_type:complete